MNAKAKVGRAVKIIAVAAVLSSPLLIPGTALAHTVRPSCASHHHRQNLCIPPVSPTASGPLARASLNAAFGPDFASYQAFCGFSNQNVMVSAGVIRVLYRAGSSAPSAGTPYGGAQLCEPFTAGPSTTAHLSYLVRFPFGFQFVKGGKLPGIYGGREPFSGGAHNAGGWSARLMWRARGAGEVYAYLANTSGYGDEFGKGQFTFRADGVWHRLTETITVNHPGHADGRITLGYDGRTVIDQAGLRITDQGVPATGLFFSTFYGGHDASWSPSTDQHADFQGFTAH